MTCSRKLGFLVLLNLFSIQIAFAQSNPLLGFFSASENKGSVYLSWQIVAGSTCNGIQIYRSTDNISFVQIGDIPGICGDISFAVDYDFTDIDPVKNAINYYRLELGNNGYSQVLAVEVIDIAKNGFQVRPNPAYGLSKILFENDNSTLHNLTIYNTLGELVFLDSGKNDFFEFDAGTFQNGTYFFTIATSSNNAILQGKVMVIHGVD
jgi:hypothetical protein